MDGMPLSLPSVLLGVLLVLLVLVLVVMVVRRRRASAAGSDPVSITDEWDGAQSLSGTVVSREQRRVIESVLSSARGSHGRHAAVSAAPSGVLMLLVPIAGKRRSRHADVAPRLVSIPADSIDDIEMVDAEIDREPEAAVITVAPSAPPAPSAPSVPDDSERRDAEAATHDLRTYQRRVTTTIQAISQRIGPGELPEVVEARMLAAVDRLDGPLEFARPTLSPSGPLRSFGQLESRAQAEQSAVPSAPPVPSVPVASAPPAAPAPPAPPPSWSDEPATHEPPVSEAPVEDTLIVEAPFDDTPVAAPPLGEPAVDEPEVVLPVPLLTTPTAVRRRGFRPRGRND